MNGDVPQPQAPPVQQVEYANPHSQDARSRSLLRNGLLLGAAAAFVGVPACAFVGGIIEGQLNKGQHLAGLAGFLLGGMGAIGLVILVAIAAFIVGHRRRRPFLRGLAIGMAVALGVGALGVGLCMTLA